MNKISGVTSRRKKKLHKKYNLSSFRWMQQGMWLLTVNIARSFAASFAVTELATITCTTIGYANILMKEWVHLWTLSLIP